MCYMYSSINQFADGFFYKPLIYVTHNCVESGGLRFFVESGRIFGKDEYGLDIGRPTSTDLLLW
jgi:hypothetical protein